MVPLLVTSAISALVAATATGAAIAAGAWATRTWTIRPWATGACARWTRTTGPRSLAGPSGWPVARRALAVRIEATGVGMIGREVRCIARMAIRLGRACRAAFAGSIATVPTWTTIGAGTIAWAAIRIRAWTTRAAISVWTRATGTAIATGRTRATRTTGTRTGRLAAVRLARTAWTLRVAMAGRTGVHAIRHEPGARRSGVVATLLARAQLLALWTWALGLEGFLRLLRRRFAADGQATLFAWRAATATILAHVVEAAQLTPFVGRAVTTHITRSGRTTDMHRGLGRLALAEHRHQGQRGWRAFLKTNRGTQCIDLGLRQLLRVSAQQWLRQAHIAVADALQAADLAAL